ncbi:hypothetical protein BDV10DRAFT_193168 [Aspergillus recurvatus]
MRRVEQNGRSSPGCPWSIRHTGVYQRLVCSVDDLREPSSTILLVAPSSAIESSVLEMATDSSNNLNNAFSVHKSIVAGSLTGWMDYMCWLEDQLKLKVCKFHKHPAIFYLIEVDLVDSTESRALSFIENDRHDLRQLEEYITDLRVLLHTKVQTIRRLTASHQSLCSLRCPEPRHCECRQTIQELEEYVDEAQMYQERAEVLQDRVQSVQKLLSDLLGYEELRTLRELMQLAIIGLVFIPTTLVENFFSTEFVKVDGETLQVSRHAWLMAAVAVPMTLCVVVFWRLWLRCELADWRKKTRGTGYDAPFAKFLRWVHPGWAGRALPV